MVLKCKPQQNSWFYNLNHFIYLRPRPPGDGQGLNAYPSANSRVMLVAIAQINRDRFVGVGDA